jgi:hypothetical protein
MSLVVDGGYRSVDAMNPIKGYQEPFVVIAPILDNRDGIMLGQTR